MSRRWTEDEICTLRERYACGDVRQIAASLGRSTRAVYARAAVEGLRRAEMRRAGTWTDAQDGLLERLCGRMDAGEIARRVGHTRRATQQRMHVLRLTRAQPPDGFVTAAQAARQMGVKTDCARKRLERGGAARRRIGGRVYYARPDGGNV